MNSPSQFMKHFLYYLLWSAVWGGGSMGTIFLILERLREVEQVSGGYSAGYRGNQDSRGSILVLPPVLSSCSITMASALYVFPSISALRTLVLTYFNPLNVQSNLDPPCILLCDCRKEILLLTLSFCVPRHPHL